MRPSAVLPYCAGLMDSDGYFSIRKSSRRRRLKKDMVNTSYIIRIGAKQVQPGIAIRLLHMTFGGYLRDEKPNAKRGRPFVSWQITDRSAETAIRRLLPFLQIKRKQAETLLELRRLKREGFQGIVHTIAKTRWGNETDYRHRCYSPEQVSRMDALYLHVRELNGPQSLSLSWPKE